MTPRMSGRLAHQPPLAPSASHSSPCTRPQLGSEWCTCTGTCTCSSTRIECAHRVALAAACQDVSCHNLVYQQQPCTDCMGLSRPTQSLLLREAAGQHAARAASRAGAPKQRSTIESSSARPPGRPSRARTTSGYVRVLVFRDALQGQGIVPSGTHTICTGGRS